ncbi:MAG: hypothetical protein IPL07_09595, partial [Acidimicrobiaceae bacterium]|nr:hypothetical protein [Acidimicrobiaceae bacterium]
MEHRQGATDRGGLEIIVPFSSSLVLGEGDPGAHDGRHLGSFSIAYAVALLVVAVRP